MTSNVLKTFSCLILIVSPTSCRVQTNKHILHELPTDFAGEKSIFLDKALKMS